LTEKIKISIWLCLYKKEKIKYYQHKNHDMRHNILMNQFSKHTVQEEKFTLVGSRKDHAGEEADNKEGGFAVRHAELVDDEAIAEGKYCGLRPFWSTWSTVKSWKSFLRGGRKIEAMPPS
jgi:hypothetical protein